jgi:hypothetical protein
VSHAASGAGIEGEGEQEPALGGFDGGEVALPIERARSPKGGTFARRAAPEGAGKRGRADPARGFWPASSPRWDEGRPGG